jgi:hypothetical protein
MYISMIQGAIIYKYMNYGRKKAFFGHGRILKFLLDKPYPIGYDNKAACEAEPFPAVPARYPGA